MKPKQHILIFICRFFETVAQMLFVVLTAAFFISAWSGEALRAAGMFFLNIFLRYIIMEIKAAEEYIINNS